MLTQPPSSVDVKTLDLMHPHLQANFELYGDLDLLYRGGNELRQSAARFLTKSPRELGAVYATRLQRLTYQNILASIVTWYVSKILPPSSFEIDLKPPGGPSLPAREDAFYGAFLSDCDNAGSSLSDFFKRAAEDALVFGRSHILVDLPQLPVEPENLAEQQALGGLSPYLVRFGSKQVKNWQTDRFGNYLWVLIHTCEDVQDFLQGVTVRERWMYYDRQNYAVYGVDYRKGTARPTMASLLPGKAGFGVHALASRNEVPLYTMLVDHPLWLGNRLFLGLREHLDAENSYSWSLHLTNNPIPVFTNGKEGSVDTNQTASEYAAVILPFEGGFKWVEPDGKSFMNSAIRLQSLREELYRSAHLLSQGRVTHATDAAQSGEAKALDMQPAADVLNEFSNAVREAIQDVLEDVSAIRGDAVVPDVRGLNFSDDGLNELITSALEMRKLGVPSMTLHKEVLKKIARAALRDANSELLDVACNEIDAAQIDLAADELAVQVNERLTGSAD